MNEEQIKPTVNEKQHKSISKTILVAHLNRILNTSSQLTVNGSRDLGLLRKSFLEKFQVKLNKFSLDDYEQVETFFLSVYILFLFILVIRFMLYILENL